MKAYNPKSVKRGGSEERMKRIRLGRRIDVARINPDPQIQHC